MTTKLAVWVLLIGLAIQGLPAVATAACGPYFSGYGATPWACSSSNTYLHVRNTLPYFALHPPVYYSHWVSRPYGLSPFADFPGSAGLQPVQLPSPQMVDVMQKEYRPRPKPLRIINPYVVQLGDNEFSPEATVPRPPQVVHPAVTTELP